MRVHDAFEMFAYGALLAAVAVALTGCAGTPKTEIQYLTRPCTENTPQRPAMPTVGYVWNGLDGFVAVATAEIDRREAYERELLTALENCKRQ